MKDHMCKVWSEPQRGYDLSAVSSTLCNSDTVGESDCLAGEPAVSECTSDEAEAEFERLFGSTPDQPTEDPRSALAARRRTTLLLAEWRSVNDAIAQELRIYQAMAEAIEANCIEACHYVRGARGALLHLRAGREQVIA